MNQWFIRAIIQNPDKTNDPKTRNAYGALASWVGIVGNVVLCTMKAIIGLSIHSVAIVADAANNLSDMASNVVTLFGFKLASRPADKEHPYGHGRFEYLSSMVVSVFILFVGFQVVLSSGKSLISPKEVILTSASVIIMVLSIVIKAWMSSFNSTIGKKIDSQALLSAAQDSKNDCLVTLSILICTFVSETLEILWLNGVVGIGVGLLIIKTGWDCLVDSVNPLLGSPADPKKIEGIAKKIKSYDHVLGIHDLVLHDYGPGRTFASVHVEMPSDMSSIQTHEILDAMQYDFYINDQIDLTAHLDPRIKDDTKTEAVRRWLEEHKREVSEQITFHDFHTSICEGKPTLTVDCSAPFNLDMSDEELTETLCKLMLQYDSDIRCKIRIDRV